MAASSYNENTQGDTSETNLPYLLDTATFTGTLPWSHDDDRMVFDITDGSGSGAIKPGDTLTFTVNATNVGDLTVDYVFTLKTNAASGSLYNLAAEYGTGSFSVGVDVTAQTFSIQVPSNLVDPAYPSLDYVLVVGVSGYGANVSDATYTLNIQGSGTTTPTNRAPVANPDTATTTVGKPVTINVLANDSDPDGDPLNISLSTNTSAHGSVTLNPDHTITYSPVAGYVGTDTFSYGISDGHSHTTMGAVSVTIGAATQQTPDLVASWNSLTPATVADNGTLSFDYNVSNNGAGDAPGSKIGFFLSEDSVITTSDTLILDFDNEGLAASSGEQTTFSAPISAFYKTIPAGQYYIGVITDYLNTVVESNENNNASTGIPITITASNPDNLVDFASSLPDTPPTQSWSDTPDSNTSDLIEHDDAEDQWTLDDPIGTGSEWLHDSLKEYAVAKATGAVVTEANTLINAIGDKFGVSQLYETVKNVQHLKEAVINLHSNIFNALGDAVDGKISVDQLSNRVDSYLLQFTDAVTRISENTEQVLDQAQDALENTGDRYLESAASEDASFAAAALAATPVLHAGFKIGFGPITGSLLGSDGNDAILGTSQNDTIVGGAGADILLGMAGNDTMQGGTGIDRMLGGKGNDFYYVDDARDQVIEAVGGGNDRVYTSVSYALAAGQEIETLVTTLATATTAINLTGNEFGQTIVANAGANTINGKGGIDLMYGLGGNDLYYVDSAGDRVFESVGGGNDRVYASVSYALAAGQEIETLVTTLATATTAINLTGNEFAQTIVANAGANRIDGKGGIDLMYGLGGNDLYYVDNAGDRVFESVGGGNDRVYTSVSYTLAAGQEIETFVTTLATATTAINLTGNEFAQTIVANAGANRIDGKGGIDLMYGLGGNDLYYVDNAGDRVFESVGGGNDRVYTSVSYTLAAGQEIETFVTTLSTATTPINLTGNEFAQTIVANAGANRIDGKGGIDLMYGLGGNDVYYVDNSADRVFESVGGGNDHVYTSVSYTLGAGQEIETLSTTLSTSTVAINLTGNEFANTITGNAGVNTIDGKGGIDNLYGLGGNDIYYVDNVSDHVFEGVNGGNDRVYASLSYTLGAGQEIETLSATLSTSTVAINLTGNEFSNTIIGNAGSNILRGGGGTAADVLSGLGGDDFYYVNHAGDSIIETTGGGTDRVLAHVSYTLNAGAQVEILSTDNNAATGTIDLTGNEFGQTIYGNAGANTINGGGGNDILIGLGGNDSFLFNTTLNGSTNVDLISNFTVSTGAAGDVDKILLDDAIFGALNPTHAPTPFTLSSDAFTNAPPTNANQHVIYNATNGTLFYDDDGNGVHTAVQFATLSPHPALTNADFLVV